MEESVGDWRQGRDGEEPSKEESSYKGKMAEGPKSQKDQ